MHPRHQRLWYAHQNHQELMRRHMGSTITSQPPAAGPPPPPLPAHLTNSIPFGGNVPAAAGASMTTGTGIYPPFYHHHHHAAHAAAAAAAGAQHHRHHAHAGRRPQIPAHNPGAAATAAADHHLLQVFDNIHHHHPPHMIPFLAAPVRYNDAYFRIIEQRRSAENNRGASKGCIERNTFPHKFKKIVRAAVAPASEAEEAVGEKEKKEEEEDDVDKCTICLCGK